MRGEEVMEEIREVTMEDSPSTGDLGEVTEARDHLGEVPWEEVRVPALVEWEEDLAPAMEETLLEGEAITPDLEVIFHTFLGCENDLRGSVVC